MTTKPAAEPSREQYRLPDGRTKLKAHDIRHLCTCERCGNLADDRATINPNHAPIQLGKHWHPKCYWLEFGTQVVVERLTREQQDKFALCDIPVKVMKAILRCRGEL